MRGVWERNIGNELVEGEEEKSWCVKKEMNFGRKLFFL